jgi:predicted ATPase
MSFDCKEKQGPVGSRYGRHGDMSETNWYVITGAPSSGKTTLLKELEELGYRVIHEVARAFIEMEMEQANARKD